MGLEVSWKALGGVFRKDSSQGSISSCLKRQSPFILKAGIFPCSAQAYNVDVLILRRRESSRMSRSGLNMARSFGERRIRVRMGTDQPDIRQVSRPIPSVL